MLDSLRRELCTYCPVGDVYKRQAVSNGELNMTARIEGSTSTRAEKFDWEENDQLGVFVCNGTIEQPYLGNADRYTNRCV